MIETRSEITEKYSSEEISDKSLSEDKVRGHDVGVISAEIGTDFSYKHKVVWNYALVGVIFHLLGLVGIILVLRLQVHPLTIIHSFVLLILTELGITMGAHRYFTHRTFKANIIIRRVLIVLFTMCGQNSLWQWVKDHRQHHKYSDTDADPHNARRGFFFSHVGWLISERHPKVLQYSKGIDMSDLEADSWIMFQNKYYFQVYAVVCVFIPCIIPIILWNEDPVKSFLVCYSARTCLSLTFTCFINSLAHTYGQRPYDKTILPRQNKFVSIFIAGEGWHNFHHAFPWDYRASELGTSFNLAANAIDLCAKMGWVYDLKTVSEQSLEKRIKKTGDNSHEKYGKQACKKLI